MTARKPFALCDAATGAVVSSHTSVWACHVAAGQLADTVPPVDVRRWDRAARTYSVPCLGVEDVQRPAQSTKWADYQRANQALLDQVGLLTHARTCDCRECNDIRVWRIGRGA